MLTLDFNVVRNNARYRSTLRNMNVLDKVKYILNEDLAENDTCSGTDIEPLEFGKEHLAEVGFNTVANLPILPKSVFLNRIHDGKPVILDNHDYTLKTRYEFFKICNEIWEIECFPEIERKVVGLNQEELGKKKKRGLLW